MRMRIKNYREGMFKCKITEAEKYAVDMRLLNGQYFLRPLLQIKHNQMIQFTEFTNRSKEQNVRIREIFWHLSK